MRAVLTAAAVLFATTLAPALADSSEKCTCKHLKALREMRAEEQAMRDYMARREKELVDQQVAITQTDAGWEEKERQIKALTESHEGTVADDTDTLIKFDNDTCEPDADMLRRQMEKAPCAEAAATYKAHENYHHDVCAIRRAGKDKPAPQRRTSAPIDDDLLMGLKMGFPSFDALEEMTAYQIQIDALNELIKKLEDGAQYTMIVKSYTRIDWNRPMGPMGSGAEYAWTANVPLTVAEGAEPRDVTGHATRNFEGRILGGQCQYTGMPMPIDTPVAGQLADGRFKLKFNPNGMALPSFGVNCPHGGGMSVPLQMAPQGPGDIDIEAADGAKWTYDYANTAMAMMMAQVARVSGTATVEVEACKKEE